MYFKIDKLIKIKIKSSNIVLLLSNLNKKINIIKIKILTLNLRLNLNFQKLCFAYMSVNNVKYKYPLIISLITILGLLVHIYLQINFIIFNETLYTILENIFFIKSDNYYLNFLYFNILIIIIIYNAKIISTRFNFIKSFIIINKFKISIKKEFPDIFRDNIFLRDNIKYFYVTSTVYFIVSVLIPLIFVCIGETIIFKIGMILFQRLYLSVLFTIFIYNIGYFLYNFSVNTYLSIDNKLKYFIKFLLFLPYYNLNYNDDHHRLYSENKDEILNYLNILFENYLNQFLIKKEKNNNNILKLNNLISRLYFIFVNFYNNITKIFSNLNINFRTLNNTNLYLNKNEIKFNDNIKISKGKYLNLFTPFLTIINLIFNFLSLFNDDILINKMDSSDTRIIEKRKSIEYFDNKNSDRIKNNIKTLDDNGFIKNPTTNKEIVIVNKPIEKLNVTITSTSNINNSLGKSLINDSNINNIELYLQKKTYIDKFLSYSDSSLNNSKIINEFNRLFKYLQPVFKEEQELYNFFYKLLNSDLKVNPDFGIKNFHDLVESDKFISYKGYNFTKGDKSYVKDLGYNIMYYLDERNISMWENPINNCMDFSNRVKYTAILYKNSVEFWNPNYSCMTNEKNLVNGITNYMIKFRDKLDKPEFINALINSIGNKERIKIHNSIKIDTTELEFKSKKEIQEDVENFYKNKDKFKKYNIYTLVENDPILNLKNNYGNVGVTESIMNEHYDKLLEHYITYLSNYIKKNYNNNISEEDNIKIIKNKVQTEEFKDNVVSYSLE